MTPTVAVTGRFPPPVDGQTIATRRLASLLGSEAEVRRIDVSAGDRRLAESQVLFRPTKLWHYLTAAPHLHRELSSLPDAPVLWTSISPAILGHFRDLLTIIPAFTRSQRVYAVIHWGNFDRLFRSSITRLTARRLVDRLEGFVFLTRDLSERCSRWIPPEKRFVIPNTIDDPVLCTEEEITLKRNDRRQRSSFRLLFLSNMTPSKGYMDVLEATRLLLERNVNVSADFVGRWETDNDREVFHASVSRHQLESQVTHHEAIYNREKIKALHLQADLFVLPTYYPTEAQPLTIIEALNAGTPIIATRHAGIPEMVTEEREARLISPKDPKAIADAVAALEPFERWLDYSRAARQRFIDRYSPEAVRHRWLNLLDQPDRQPTSTTTDH